MRLDSALKTKEVAEEALEELLPVNVPYPSYLTNEQVIRHDLQAIQSQASSNGVEDMPNLAFVGP